MTDPMSGGIGQAAQELLKDMQQSQKSGQSGAQGAGGQDFQNAMGEAQGPKGADATSKTSQSASATAQTDAAQSASNILQQAKAQRQAGVTQVGQTKKTTKQRMVKMLDGLIKGQDKMGEIMDMALSGRQFSPPELLVMQASIFRFTQELELTGKVIEKATSGVKQTLNTQV